MGRQNSNRTQAAEMLDIVLCLASSEPKKFRDDPDENKGEAHQPGWDRLQIFVDVLRFLHFDEYQTLERHLFPTWDTAMDFRETEENDQPETQKGRANDRYIEVLAFLVKN